MTSYDDWKLRTPRGGGQHFNYGEPPKKHQPYLKRIEGTDLYITRFGVVLDKDGKEVKTEK